jgi:beta-phosphoglucomutase-like phosphatase (HAD superfamily)
MDSKPALLISKQDYDAVIFDLDGVVTRTARVHSAAWKRLFDEYLERISSREGKSQPPFDPGKPTTCATWTGSRATTA